MSPYNSEASERLVGFLEFLSENKGIKKIAILAETTDYGVGQAKAIEYFIKDKNLPIEVLTEYFEYGVVDLTPQLVKIKDYHVDVLINIASASPTVHLIARQGKEVGLFPDVLHVVGWGGPILPDFWEVAGEAGVDTCYLAEFHPAILKSPLGEKFAQAFKAKYGIVPPYYASLVYEGVRVIADAIKRAGNTESDALITALRETSLEGIYGTIEFKTVGTEGPIFQAFTKHPFCICQYQQYNVPHEESVIVWPPDLATGNLRWR
jgi:branched-chain amino acid transport system substrate-binding protein